jgi:hypothetical protein
MAHFTAENIGSKKDKASEGAENRIMLRQSEMLSKLPNDSV